MKRPFELFMDSGAYSALTQQTTIDVNDYISFIKKNISLIDHYANLDVIGDAGKTFTNQTKMEAAGLSPIPVYHYGDPKHFLTHYLNKYDYIGLGGMVPIPSKKLGVWLDELFGGPLKGKDGYPIVKVHGFGLTEFRLMFRYPWYSVDSSSWVIMSRTGSIFMPICKGKTYDYNQPPLRVSVSNKSPNLKNVNKAHFENLTPNQKTIVLNYLKHINYSFGKSEWKTVKQNYELQENERWAEKKPEDSKKKRLVEIVLEKGVCNTYQLRDEVNALYFIEVEKLVPAYPWKFERQHKHITLFK